MNQYLGRLEIFGSRFLQLTLLTVICFPLFGVAQTQKTTLRLDQASTAIEWTLQATTHTVHGIFRLKGGLITLDPQTGAAEGEILVELASGDSGNDRRDSRMQKEVLESDKYPVAFFHPTRITGALKPGGDQTVKVDGTFNIHGNDHPLTLTVQTGLHGGQVTATTRFTVPYVAWGMKDPSSFLLRVGKEVLIHISAHGSIEVEASK